MRDQAAAWHVRSVVLRLDSWNLYGARGLWSEKARGGGGLTAGGRPPPPQRGRPVAERRLPFRPLEPAGGGPGVRVLCSRASRLLFERERRAGRGDQGLE